MFDYEPIITIHKGRTFIAIGNKVIYSAIGDMSDFITINDAGCFYIQPKEKIKQMFTFGQILMIFTDYSIFVLRNDKPENFILEHITGRLLWN